ncbi:conserved hypothetical protein [Altererythrobacter sp. B11]|nr:conserved hypothetical protein [Altererythrobacter sp. B11]
MAGAPEAYAENAVECALDGGKAFERTCPVERSVEDGRLFLTIRHPDGGFRRFEVLDDGSGLAAADGADPAHVTLRDPAAGGGIEVAIGGDRYRLPATLSDDAKP